MEKKRKARLQAQSSSGSNAAQVGPQARLLHAQSLSPGSGGVDSLDEVVVPRGFGSDTVFENRRGSGVAPTTMPRVMSPGSASPAGSSSQASKHGFPITSPSHSPSGKSAVRKSATGDTYSAEEKSPNGSISSIVGASRRASYQGPVGLRVGQRHSQPVVATLTLKDVFGEDGSDDEDGKRFNSMGDQDDDVPTQLKGLEISGLSGGGSGGLMTPQSRDTPPSREAARRASMRWKEVKSSSELGYDVQPQGEESGEPSPDPLVCVSEHIGMIRKPNARSNSRSGNVGKSMRSPSQISECTHHEDYNEDGYASDGSNPDEVFVGDWTRKEGEGEAQYMCRLYFENMNKNMTHEENCELLLRQVLEHIAHQVLQNQLVMGPGGSGGRLRKCHQIKLQTFLRSTVLAVPSHTNLASSWKKTMQGILTPKQALKVQIPQISEADLLYRLEYFTLTLREAAKGAKGSDILVDPHRCEGLVKGYCANVVDSTPLSNIAQKILPPILHTMACDILGVQLLSPEVRTVVRKIVSDFEGRQRMWLSPVQCAERFLRPLVLEFASWLRQNADVLVHASTTEALLRCVDKNVRYRLKNQVYMSAEHFMQVFKSMQYMLTDIKLPALGDSGASFDPGQTMKDINRERFDLAGSGESSSPIECVELLRQKLTMAMKKAAAPPPTPKKKPVHHSLVRAATTPTDRLDRGMNVVQISVTDDCSSSENSDEEALGPLGTSRDDPLHPYPGAEYVDHCVWRGLHAASRTASGGDSFFIVQDLFGGDLVLIKASRKPLPPIAIHCEGLVLKVTTTNAYDIYHLSDVAGETSALPLPLMTVTTILKEVITFLPFLADSYCNAPPPPMLSVTPREKKLAFLSAGSVYTEKVEPPPPNKPSYSLDETTGRYLTVLADLPDLTFLEKDEAPPGSPSTANTHSSFASSFTPDSPREGKPSSPVSEKSEKFPEESSSNGQDVAPGDPLSLSAHVPSLSVRARRRASVFVVPQMSEDPESLAAAQSLPAGTSASEKPIVISL